MESHVGVAGSYRQVIFVPTELSDFLSDEAPRKSQVGRFADNLAGMKGVFGDPNTVEIFGELCGEFFGNWSLGGDLRFRGQDEADFLAREFLIGQKRQCPPQQLFGLINVRDKNEVAKLTVPGQGLGPLFPVDRGSLFDSKIPAGSV